MVASTGMGDGTLPDSGAHSAQGYLRFHTKFQRSRSVVYTTAFLVGAAAITLGAVEVGWETAGALFGVALASALVAGALLARGHRTVLLVPVTPATMVLDIGFLTALLYVTGGLGSNWFPWYLANSAAAAYAYGRRGTILVSAGNVLAYFGMVAATEPLTPATFTQAAMNMLILYGAAVFAVLGIADLQAKRRTISELQRAEARRARDLESASRELRRRSEELDRANEALREVSLTDTLTGLRNRRYMAERIPEDVAQVLRRREETKDGKAIDPSNANLGFVMLDIDHFKRINDLYGHHEGDEALVHVARVLAEAVRTMDTVIRWGGEEFLIVARQVNRAYLPVIAGRLQAAIRNHPFRPSDGNAVVLTCSVGFCHFPFGVPEVFTWEQALSLADTALMLAKRAGRDTVVGIDAGQFPEQVGSGFGRRALDDVIAALEAGHLRLICDGEIPLDSLTGP